MQPMMADAPRMSRSKMWRLAKILCSARRAALSSPLSDCVFHFLRCPDVPIFRRLICGCPNVFVMFDTWMSRYQTPLRTRPAKQKRGCPQSIESGASDFDAPAFWGVGGGGGIGEGAVKAESAAGMVAVSIGAGTPERTIWPAESHCLISKTSSRVSSG